MSGPNLTIITGDHYYVPQRWLKTITDEEKPKECDQDVIIDDVWIGEKFTILKGVHIGKSAIIAAGEVVTKDIPDFAIAGGIPASVIKYKWIQEERNYHSEFLNQNNKKKND